MVKINGENREHLTDLNVPHLGEKIKKTCANRPVSCVNGENPSKRMSFGSPFGRSFSAAFSSKNCVKIQLIGHCLCYTPVRTKKDRGGDRNERGRAAVCRRSCGGVHGGGGLPVLGGHPAGGDGGAGRRLMHSREYRAAG